MDFPTLFQNFVYKRTYARWLDEESRRENWPETIARYATFFRPSVPKTHHPEFDRAIQAILNCEVMPSMRCLWAAGEALKRDNISGYNCSALIIDTPSAFGEVLYLLMNGAGVGFSVERQFVNKLPAIPEKLDEGAVTILFADSKLGWAEGLNQLIALLYKGAIPKFDLSKIRPKGARLKTFGGRASGPEPLKKLIESVIKIFIGAKGRKLTSLECHDICCHIASSVVVGGVRRSAMVSLSNLSDQRMAHAKDGNWFDLNPQRQFANNSVAYTEKPDCTLFMEEWLTLARSGSGERGIFNREAARSTIMRNGRRNPDHDWMVNPCGEIYLRPYEFCNLSEVVIRAGDTLEALIEKVRYATILGTLQSTLTKFKFINRKWKKNTEEERLLGVSLTGLRDHEILGRKTTQAALFLQEMKAKAIETAREWSSALEIPMPAAITCTKPSGTVSQLVNSASGLHPRYAPYYIRRVRVSAVDPLANFLIDQGLRHHPEPKYTLKDSPNIIFEFPIRSPEEAICRDQTNAIEQLEYWKMIQTNWCEHNSSISVYVNPDEWFETGAWVYKNWNLIAGVAFFPTDSGNYEMPPYEEINEEKYNAMVETVPEIDFDGLSEFESEDNTQGAKEYACQGGACEL